MMKLKKRKDELYSLKKPLNSSWLGQYRALVTNTSSAVLKLIYNNKIGNSLF